MVKTSGEFGGWWKRGHSFHLEQHAEGLGVAVLCGHVQGAVAAEGGHVGAGAGVGGAAGQQQLRQARVAAPGHQVQRRGALGVLGVGLRLGRQQQLRHLKVAVQRRKVQRRVPRLVAAVHVQPPAQAGWWRGEGSSGSVGQWASGSASGLWLRQTETDRD